MPDRYRQAESWLVFLRDSMRTSKLSVARASMSEEIGESLHIPDLNSVLRFSDDYSSRRILNKRLRTCHDLQSEVVVAKSDTASYYITIG